MTQEKNKSIIKQQVVDVYKIVIYVAEGKGLQHLTEGHGEWCATALNRCLTKHAYTNTLTCELNIMDSFIYNAVYP